MVVSLPWGHVGIRVRIRGGVTAPTLNPFSLPDLNIGFGVRAQSHLHSLEGRSPTIGLKPPAGGLSTIVGDRLFGSFAIEYSGGDDDGYGNNLNYRSHHFPRWATTIFPYSRLPLLEHSNRNV